MINNTTPNQGNKAPSKAENSTPTQGGLDVDALVSQVRAMGAQNPNDSGWDNFKQGFTQGAKSLLGGFAYASGEVADLLSFDEAGKNAKLTAQNYMSDVPMQDDSIGQFLGSLVPSVIPSAVAIASAPVTGSALAIGSMAGLSVSSAGNGMMEYEQYKTSKGLEVSPFAKFSVGVAYGVAEALAERFSLGKLMPSMGSGFLMKGNIKSAEKAGEDLLTLYAKNNPSGYKTLMRKIGTGMYAEGGEEVITEIAQSVTQMIYQEGGDRMETLKDMPNNMLHAFVGGAIMGTGLAPLSFGSQNVANIQRRKQQGGVTIVQSQDGGVYEIIGLAEEAENGEPIYSVMDKRGEVSELPSSEIIERAELSVDQFDKLLQDKLDHHSIDIATREPMIMANYGDQPVKVIGKGEAEGRVFIELADGTQKSVFESDLEDTMEISPEEQILGEMEDPDDFQEPSMDPVETVRERQGIIEDENGDFIYPDEQGAQEEQSGESSIVIGSGKDKRKLTTRQGEDGVVEVTGVVEGEDLFDLSEFSNEEADQIIEQINASLGDSGMEAVKLQDPKNPLGSYRIAIFPAREQANIIEQVGEDDGDRGLEAKSETEKSEAKDKTDDIAVDSAEIGKKLDDIREKYTDKEMVDADGNKITFEFIDNNGTPGIDIYSQNGKRKKKLVAYLPEYQEATGNTLEDTIERMGYTEAESDQQEHEEPKAKKETTGKSGSNIGDTSEEADKGEEKSSPESEGLSTDELTDRIVGSAQFLEAEDLQTVPDVKTAHQEYSRLAKENAEPVFGEVRDLLKNLLDIMPLDSGIDFQEVYGKSYDTVNDGSGKSTSVRVAPGKIDKNGYQKLTLETTETNKKGDVRKNSGKRYGSVEEMVNDLAVIDNDTNETMFEVVFTGMDALPSAKIKLTEIRLDHARGTAVAEISIGGLDVIFEIAYPLKRENVNTEMTLITAKSVKKIIDKENGVSPKSESAPKDGWKNNLIKARQHAKALFDAGKFTKSEMDDVIKPVWTDQYALVDAIEGLVAKKTEKKTDTLKKTTKAKFNKGDSVIVRTSRKKPRKAKILERSKPKKGTPMYGNESWIYRVEFEDGRKAMGIAESTVSKGSESKSTKAGKLKSKEEKAKDELDELFGEFGDKFGDKLNTGIDPEAIKLSVKIIAKGAEIGFIKFQQFANFVIESKGEVFWKNIFANFRASYSAQMMMEGNPNDEDLNALAKTKAEDFISDEIETQPSDTTEDVAETKEAQSEDSDEKSYDMTTLNYEKRYEDYTLVAVDVDDLLRTHLEDAPDYSIMDKDNQIGNRVKNAREYIEKNYDNKEASFNPSVVSINNGKLDFEDGRHRVMSARMLGSEKVMVEINPSDVDALNDRLAMPAKKATKEPLTPLIEEVDVVEETEDAPKEPSPVKRSYNSEGHTKRDVNEQGNKKPRRDIQRDVAKYSKELAQALGFDHHVATSGKNKGRTRYADTNIALSGGESSFYLWDPNSDYGVYVQFSFDQDFGDNDTYNLKEEMLYRIVTKEKMTEGVGNNHWQNSNVRAEFLAKRIQKVMSSYNVDVEVTETAPEPVKELKFPKIGKGKALYANLNKIVDLADLKPEFYEKRGDNGDDYMPLNIEHLGWLPDEAKLDRANLQVPGYVLSMSHTYLQEGDVMNDPEVRYAIFPSTKQAYAISFRQDGTIQIDQNYFGSLGSYQPRGIKDTNAFTNNLWIPNLIAQGKGKADQSPEPEAEEDNTLSTDELLFVKSIHTAMDDNKLISKATLRTLADNTGLSDITDKRLKELAEYSVLLRATQIIEDYTVSEFEDMYKVAYKEMVELYERQPNMTARSGQSMLLQQYSTPVPIAMMMGIYTNMHQGVASLEPSAGNGYLTLSAGKTPRNVMVNEIDSDRLQMLGQQEFFKIMDQDGSMRFDGLDRTQQAIVTNPPFGATEASMTVTTVGGKTATLSKLDHIMTARALETMRNDGKASILVGGHDEFDEKGRRKAGQDGIFFNWLYHHYNVEDIINLNGDLYRKQGTTFPIRVILINGRKDTPEGRAPRESEVDTTLVDSFDAFYERIRPQLTEANHEPILQSTLVSNNRSGTPVLGDGTSDSADQDLSGSGTVSGNGSSKTGGRGGKSSSTNSGSPTGTRGSGNGGSGQRTGFDTTKQRSNADSTRGSEDSNTSQQVESSADSEQTARGNLQGEKSSFGDGVDVEDILESTNGNVPYSPLSDAMPLTTEMPAQMALSMQSTLRRVADEVGNVDAFVANELGYESIEEMIAGLGGEQVDAVAIAILQHRKGKALIVGDQTGIGKGRVAGAMIRYAKMKGLIPVFVTEKPKLFSDIHRDLVNIGSPDLSPFIMNSDKKAKVYDQDSNVVFTPLGSSNGERKRILESGDIGQFDYVAMTYSQVATSQGSAKKDFIRSISKNAFMIFDEAHNASGSSNTGAFITNVLSEASGALYLSATFAKRPNNMPVYAVKTDISDAGMDMEAMVEAIESGGVVLQEILSADLVKAGQMVRRQRSFDGVKRGFEIVGTDMETGKLTKEGEHQRKIYDEVSEVMRDIIYFQNAYVSPVIAEMDDDVKVTMPGGNKMGGVDNQPFVSRIHNIVDQLLFSIKVDKVAEETIAELKAGRKPIIALRGTMESILSDLYPEDNQEVNLHFSVVLSRALRSVMRYRTDDPATQERTYDYLRVDELDVDGQRAHAEILEKASKVTEELIASPLDYLQKKISEAETEGFDGKKRKAVVGEVTGRKRHVELYDDNYNLGIVKSRGDDSMNKNKLFNGFNSGDVDVLIINQTGSTGSSAHSSAEFRDQRQRVMIIHQPELNINTEVQKWGRIFRTGQMNLPEYRYISSSIPAEMRLMLILKRKIKSLDANTTSSQKTNSSFLEMEDFMNKYGDRVVFDYLVENWDLNERMQKPVKESKDGIAEFEGNISSKATGRLAFLESSVQEEFYNEVSARYGAYIEMLNEYGENDLVIENLDLEAETIEKKVMVKGNKPSSVFGGDTYIEKVRAKILRKPMRKEQIKEIAENELGDKSPEQYSQDLLTQSLDFVDKRLAESLGKVETSADTVERVQRINEQHQTWRGYLEQIFNNFEPGSPFLVPLSINDVNISGTRQAIFTGFNINMNSRNPFAPSNIKLKFAINDSTRSLTIPASQRGFMLSTLGASQIGEYAKRNILNNWDSNQVQANYETRWIATGNILQAVGKVGRAGKLMSYTTKDGGVAHGVILPANISEQDLKEVSKAQVPATSMEPKIRQLSSYMRDSVDLSGNVSFEKNQYRGGMYVMIIPSSAKRGKKYYGDKKLMRLLESDFEKRGSKMRADVLEDKLSKVLKHLEAEHSINGMVDPDDPDVQLRKKLKDDLQLPARKSKRTEALAQHAEAIIEDWRTKDRIQVARTYEELPDNIQRKIDQAEVDGSKTYGAYHKGKAYIFAFNAFKIKDIEDTITHEIVGHMGLRGLLSELSGHERDGYERKYAEITTSVYERFKDDPAFADTIKSYRKSMLNTEGFDLSTDKGRAHMGEEMIAHFAETGAEKTIIDKIAQFFQDILHKLGLTTTLSRADLIDLISDMNRYVHHDMTTFIEDVGNFGVSYKRAFDNTWHSKLEDTLAKRLPGKGTTKSYKQAVKAYARKGDFKEEELEWSGLMEWLDEQKGRLSKEQVLEFMRDNNVRIEETIYGKGFNETKSADDLWDELETMLEVVNIQPEDYGDGEAVFWDVSKEREKLEYDEVIEILDNHGGQQLVEEFEITANAYESAEMLEEGNGGTSYSSVVMRPEGANYRELLLKLPVKEVRKEKGKKIRKLFDGSFAFYVDGNLLFSEFNSSAIEERVRQQLEIDESMDEVDIDYDSYFGDGIDDKYTNSHWDEPNVLVHVRFNTRAGNTLFIEEIQSDWHQQGRKRGYAKKKNKHHENLKALKNDLHKLTEWYDGVTAEMQERGLPKMPSDTEFRNFISEHTDLSDKRDQFIAKKEKIKEAMHTEKFLANDVNRNGVPDAPFKNNWHELAMKRMIRYAVENGFDRVAWTPGSVQNERNNLSKKISSLLWDHEDQVLYAYGRTGSTEHIEEGVTKERITELVGEKYAQRLFDKRQADLDKVVEIAVQNGMDKATANRHVAVLDKNPLIKKGEGDYKENPVSVAWSELGNAYRAHRKPLIDEANKKVNEAQDRYDKLKKEYEEAEAKDPEGENERGSWIDRNRDIWKSYNDSRFALGEAKRARTELFAEDDLNDIFHHGKYELRGIELEFGSKTVMNTFYDTQIPSFVKKYIKKWGAKVEARDLLLGGKPSAKVTYTILINDNGDKKLHKRNSVTGDYGDVDYRLLEELSSLKYDQSMGQAPEGELELVIEIDDQEFTMAISDDLSKPLAEVREAIDKVKKVDKIKTLSFPVTPQMRTSVMENGQPMFRKEDVRAEENFKRWFAGSKVVDENGEPKVRYHGTPNNFTEFKGSINWFADELSFAESYANIRGGDYIVEAYIKAENTFEFAQVAHAKSSVNYLLNQIKKNHDLKTAPANLLQKHKEDAQELAETHKGKLKGKVLLWELINKKSSVDLLKHFGYDSVSYLEMIEKTVRNYDTENWYDKVKTVKEWSKTLGVFDSENIKSATDNNGQYSIGEPNIMMRKKNPLTEHPHQYQKKQDALIRSYQNKFIDGKRIMKGVVKEGGSIDDTSNFIQDEENHYGRIETLKKHVEEAFTAPLVRKMRELYRDKKKNVTYNDLRRFLYANHAQERNAYLFEKNPEKGLSQSGMTDAEAEEIFAEFTERGILQDMQGVSELVQGITEHTLRTQAISGLISWKEYGALKARYENYVPLRGFEELMGMDPTMYAGKQKAEGRDSKAGDILAYVMAMSDTAIIQGEKNRVKRTFLEFVKQNYERADLFKIKNIYWKATGEIDPKTGREKFLSTFKKPTAEELMSGKVKRHLDAEKEQMLWSENTNIYEESQIRLMVDGRSVVIEVTKPHLARAFNEMDVEAIPRDLKAVSMITRYLRNVITQYSPEFGLRNLVRDSWTGLINIGIDHDLVDSAKIINPVAYAGAFKALQNYYRNNQFDDSEWGKAMKAYTKHGAGTGYWNLSEVNERTENLKKEIEKGSARNAPLTASKDMLKALGETVDDYNRIIENIARLSAFKHLYYNKVINKETGKPYTAKQASNYARNLTVNFNQKGNNSGFMGSLYLFFNATVQGIARQARPFFSEHKGIRTRAMATPIVLGATALMWNEMVRVLMGKDDDEEWYYDKITDWTRHHNIIIPNVFSSKDGDYFKIPLPYGYNTYWALGDQMNQLANGTTDLGETALNLLTVGVDAYNPIGTSSGESVAEAGYKTLLPTLFKPGFELMVNTDFAGNMIKPEAFPGQNELPQSQQYFGYVSDVSKNIAKYLNEVSGGDEFTEGLIDVSPEYLDYVFNFAFGGAGKFVSGVVNTTVNLYETANGQDELEIYDIYDVPFARSMYGAVSKNKNRSKYIENRNIIADLNSDYTAYYETGQVEKAEKFADKNSDMLQLYVELQAVNKEIRFLNQARSELYERLETEDTKSVREQLRNVADAQNEMYVSFNRLVNEVQGKTGKASALQKLLGASDD